MTQAGRTIYLDGEYLAENLGGHVEESPWKARQFLRMLRKNRTAPEKASATWYAAPEKS
jgi:hypothetical protein